MFLGGGSYDGQRLLVIRTAAITLASDSATTLARFRPSKVLRKADQIVKKRQIMSKIVQRLPKAPAKTDLGTFFGDLLNKWSVFLSGGPVQCMPITSLNRWD